MVSLKEVSVSIRCFQGTETHPHEQDGGAEF